MVKSFQFSTLPRIYFKEGILADLPHLIKAYGNSVILVTGKHSFIDSENAGSLFLKLSETGTRYQTVIISEEPSPEIINQHVSRLSSESFDMVVSIGGGSVLDAGKAISAMMYKSNPVQDFLEGIGTMDHPGTKLPFIAVPTTAGTGSEATKNAVLSRTGKGGFKRSLRHEKLVPDIALIDPLLTLDCPPDITSASGMDCFTQLTEAYLSDKSGEYTDALAIGGLKAIKRSLIQSYYEGQNRGARADMSFAALTSGICLANAGLGVVHGFASSIGGLYKIPHGVICGTLMSLVNRVNVRRLREDPASQKVLKKYALLGELFLGSKGESDDYFIDGFLEYLDVLSAELRLPGLKESGIREMDLEEICKSTENKNNPVKLGFDDLLEILTARFV